MPTPADALLFDLDGTLIDSMPLHHGAWEQWHARRGREIDAAAFCTTTAGRSNGVPPQRCIVFEDAPLGVEGAQRAGMRAVALTTTLPASAFGGFDSLIVTAPDFDTLSPTALTKEDHHA